MNVRTINTIATIETRILSKLLPTHDPNDSDFTGIVFTKDWIVVCSSTSILTSLFIVTPPSETAISKVISSSPSTNGTLNIIWYLPAFTLTSSYATYTFSTILIIGKFDGSYNLSSLVYISISISPSSLKKTELGEIIVTSLSFVEVEEPPPPIGVLVDSSITKISLSK